MCLFRSFRSTFPSASSVCANRIHFIISSRCTWVIFISETKHYIKHLVSFENFLIRFGKNVKNEKLWYDLKKGQNRKQTSGNIWKKVKNQKHHFYHWKKGKQSEANLVPFEKVLKFSKTKFIPFQKRARDQKQIWYHLTKVR